MDYTAELDRLQSQVWAARPAPAVRAAAPGRLKQVPDHATNTRAAANALEGSTGIEGTLPGLASPEEPVVAPVAPPRTVKAPCYLAFAPPGQGLGRKRAGKYYSESDLAHVLAHIDALSPVPESDRAKVLLSRRAGLRPCEIAGLKRRTLFTASGKLKDYLEVTGETAKRGKPRTIPMHPQLRGALVDLFEKYPDAEYVAFKVTRQGLKYDSIAWVTQFFAALYRAAGLHGCTGMSGRRSFATDLARFAAPSLVQKALGHASLRMIEYYVQPVGDLEDAIKQLGSEA